MPDRAVPLQTHLKRPAYRGPVARRGEVLACPMETAAFDAYLTPCGRRINLSRCRHAGQWWKVPAMIAYLTRRTEPGKVQALLAVLRDEMAWGDAAHRAGVPVAQLHGWQQELRQIVEEELWPQWSAGQH